ncbi:MAG: phosphate starvation-inducible PhoH-like protein [Sphingobacteriales bacterium]
MNELLLEIEGINLGTFWGAQNSNYNQIKKHFPKLNIIARGEQLRVRGEESELNAFKMVFQRLIAHVEKYNRLNSNDLDGIFDSTIDGSESISVNNDVIVYGPNGRLIKARTPNQKKMVSSILENDILFAIGPAGTGKTYTAVALAVKALKNKEVKRIVLTRPAVEAGESLGFLPGDLKEKIDPYLRPLYDALDDMIPKEKLNYYLENRMIEIAPLAFMRGRTLDNAFVILDEAQNTTDLQLKMFLTRMGPSAKFVLTGDVSQIDLPKRVASGLVHAIEILKNIKGIDFIRLKGSDVIRHTLVKNIIKAYDKKPQTDSKDDK